MFTIQENRDEWLHYFRSKGYADTVLLAKGMEGVVYRLNNEFVGKVWARRSVAELRRLQQVCRELKSAHLPFATPDIMKIEQQAGRSITIERRISGKPLQTYISEGEQLRWDIQKCLLATLTSLAAVREIPSSMRTLAVLDEPDALWSGKSTWPAALIGLMARRVAEFGDQLRRRVKDFDTKYARIVELVRNISVPRLGIVHGDLCGVNILVDAALQPTGVLDWGFMSMAGDPAFDASILAGIFNMDGEHARKNDDQLMELFAVTFGYPRDRMLLYRAVYSAVASNAYDPLGNDRYFAWCTASLEREDIDSILRQGKVS